MKKAILMLLPLGLLTAACTETLEKDSPVKEGKPISFTASIGSFSKATDNSFEAGDEMSLSIGAPINASAVKLTYSNGSLTPDQALYWGIDQKESEKSSFVAVAPYKASLDPMKPFDFAIAQNQTADGAYAASDLIAAKAEASPADQTVNLQFSHVLSRLLLDVSVQHYGNATVQSITLGGVQLGVKADAVNGSYTASGDPATVTPAFRNQVYTFLVAPQKVSPELLISLSNGETLRYTPEAALDFASGKQLVAQLVVSPDAIAFSSEISDWEEGEADFGKIGEDEGPVAHSWSVLGDLEGSDWSEELDMEETEPGVFTLVIPHYNYGGFILVRDHSAGYGTLINNRPVIQDEETLELPIGRIAAYTISFQFNGPIELQFIPEKSILRVKSLYEYFLNPITGEKAIVQWQQKWWGEYVNTYVKYYEEDGVRDCYTVTIPDSHCYYNEGWHYYTSDGFFGFGPELHFIWYTAETDIFGYQYIQMPTQSLWHYSNGYYDSDVYVYDAYAFYTDVYGYELGPWIDEIKAGNYRYGFYDGIGGFHLYTERYYIPGTGGWTVLDFDNIGLATGFEHKDFSVELSGGSSQDGVTPISVLAGADVSYLNYEFFEGSYSAYGILRLAKEMIAAPGDATRWANLSLDAASGFQRGHFEISPDESGDYTVIAVTYDAAGNPKGYAGTVVRHTVPDLTVWNTVGTAEWTDLFFAPWYNSDPVSYTVELQESASEPGRFRLNNVYGEPFPYNAAGDWDDSQDYGLVINATDPDFVWMEYFVSGTDWGNGNFMLQSLVSYYLVSSSLDKLKEEAPDIFGKKEGNVITFPSGTLLEAMSNYNNGTWYIGNSGSELVITLNFASPAPAPAHRISAKRQFKNQLSRENRFPEIEKSIL